VDYDDVVLILLDEETQIKNSTKRDTMGYSWKENWTRGGARGDSSSDGGVTTGDVSVECLTEARGGVTVPPDSWDSVPRRECGSIEMELLSKSK
jgi:hypothetical protein